MGDDGEEEVEVKMLDVIIVGRVADITFRSLGQAEACCTRLRKAGRDARMAAEYTTIHYDKKSADKKGGGPYSGWCTFEHGVASGECSCGEGDGSGGGEVQTVT